MIEEFSISKAVLCRILDADSLADYLHDLDPERRLITDPANINMLVPLLHHCGYQTIRELHESVKIGWNRIRLYERTHRTQGSLSGSLAILYAIIIADEPCRRKVAMEKDYEELEKYFVES